MIKPTWWSGLVQYCSFLGILNWQNYKGLYAIFYYFLRFFLDVTLSILGNFKLDVTLLFWVITSIYLSPITCSHGTLLFFIFSISLLSKNYLGVRDLKSVRSKKNGGSTIFFWGHLGNLLVSSFIDGSFSFSSSSLLWSTGTSPECRFPYRGRGRYGYGTDTPEKRPRDDSWVVGTYGSVGDG